MLQAKNQQQIVKDLTQNHTAQNILKNSNLRMQFEPPEGVREDELNSREKKFYSFSKRSYRGYVSSLIQSINQLKNKSPLLRNINDLYPQILTAKIIFDQKGNAISAKFIQTSLDDDMQILFENTISNIKMLPNPPLDLLNKNDSFTIYYQLSINK